MCARNENARQTVSSQSQERPSPSNARSTNSQTSHSPRLHGLPVKDQPVKIPTSMTALLSSTLNEPSVAAKAPGQMVEDWCSSLAQVLEARLPPQQHQPLLAPAPSISQMIVPAPAVTEPVPARQPRRKPQQTRLDLQPCASGMSSAASCPLKGRGKTQTGGPITNGNSQSMKQARLHVLPSVSHPSSANQPLQPTIHQRAVPLARSFGAALPNAIDLDPIEYILQAFDQWAHAGNSKANANFHSHSPLPENVLWFCSPRTRLLTN